jgi:hypothetical protein
MTITACIQIERCSDGVWEYAVWLGAQQLMLGFRDTRDEAYQAAVTTLENAEAQHDGK